jgi:glycosyltransferase involved in cell wall biosynthesis
MPPVPKPTRFDLVILQRVTAFGGSERHTISLIRHLAGRAWNVALIESGSAIVSRELTDLGGRLHVVTTDLPMRDLSRSQLDAWRLLLAELPADRALIAKSWYRVADLSLLRALRRAYPTVFHLEHSTLPRRTRWSFRLHVDGRPKAALWWYTDALLRWRMQATADRIIAVSDAQRRGLIDDALVAESRIVTCLNGVDTKKWQRDGEQARAFRQTHGIPDTAFVFGCVGRLAPEKGFELALQAFGAVRALAPDRDVFLCMVGDGPSRATLEDLARIDADRIRFIGELQDMVPAYSAIDTLLLPTHHEQYWSGESFGLVLAEAMACECSVIAAAFGGVPEVVSDPTCGTLLTTRDVGAWAAAMREHLDRSPEQRVRLGKAARAFVVKTHEQDMRLGALADVLSHAY